MKKIDERAKKCPYCQTDQRGWFRRHPILTTLLVIITSPFWIAALVGFFQGFTGSGSPDSSNTTPTHERQQTFHVNVHYTGTQFVITNLDKFDCQNSTMEINGGLLKGGYSYDGYILEAGQEYTVGAAQFTKSDGTRFNPFAIKPQNISIGCRGDNELTSAIWYGEF
jgi:hypothetical protein